MHNRPNSCRAIAVLLLLACQLPFLTAQSTCQDPIQAPPAVVENQLWAGADKTFYAVYDTIKFRVRSNADGPCIYTVRRDRYLPILQTDTLQLVANEETTVRFVSDTPCFLMFNVMQNWQEASMGVAVDACSITPHVYYPKDFDLFWDSLKTELAAVPLNPQVVQRPDLSDQAQTTYKMVLDNIDGKKVYGWISIPNCPGPFAAIMHLPSFGAFPVGAVNFEAFDGRIGIAISIHDYDCEQWVPEHIAYAPRDHYYSRYTNYYKAALLGCIRAIDYLFTRPEFDGVHLALTGVSQGGGLTVMAAGLDPRVKFISQGVTALCNHAGFVSGHSSGFPYWAKDAGDHSADIGKVIQETGYYDAVNFARRYKGPSLNFVGYNDDICPPASVFAAYNQFTGRKTMMHSITTGHLTPPDFWDTRSAFWEKSGMPASKFWPGCPPVPAADTIPPDSVQALVNSYSTFDTLIFSFVATGDDAHIGTAYRYNIRVSTDSLHADNFNMAPHAPLNIYPFESGTQQEYMLAGLVPGTPYFLGIKAIDEADNVGPLVVIKTTTRDVSSVQDLTRASVQAYPNPVRHTLYLRGLSERDELVVLNLLGQPFLSETAGAADVSLSVHHLPAGVYVLQVRSAGGHRQTLRFVKIE